MSYETQSLQLDPPTQLFSKLLKKLLLPGKRCTSYASAVKNSVRNNLLANWKPKYRDRTKQEVKKLNICGKTAVDKSAWVKPCNRSKVKLPYDWV